MDTNLLQGIDTVIVRVSDVDFSKTWYQQKLSFKIIYDEPALNLVVLDTNGPTSITLWQTDQPVQNNKQTASYPIFRTQEAEKAKQALLESGVKTDEVIDDGFVKYFFFYYPDGNVLEACQAHGSNELIK